MVEWEKDEVDWEARAESQLKYLGELAASQLLTEDELEWLSRPAGTALAELTEDELSKLANRYIDEKQELEFMYEFLWPWYPDYSDTCLMTLSELRLDTLKQMLGDGRFDALVAETQAKWEQRFADANNWPPCLTCGVHRTLSMVSSLDDRICGGCEMEVERAGLEPPCPRCDGERKTGGEWRYRWFCRECAARRLPPCTECGGERMPDKQDTDGGLCPACLDRRLGPCAKCGRQMDSFSASFGNDVCWECEAARRVETPCPQCGDERDAVGSAWRNASLRAAAVAAGAGWRRTWATSVGVAG